MPQMVSNATYRPELAGAVRQYNTQYAIDQQFIGTRVLPEFRTMIPAAEYPVVPKENFRKSVDTSRAPGSGFSRASWVWDKASYKCRENAHEIPMDVMDAKKYAAVIDYEIESAIGADFRVRIAHERRVANAVFDTTVFPPKTVVAPWTNFATSDPLADIDASANRLEDVMGVSRQMLTLILPRERWQNLRNSASVLAKMKNWASGITSREAIRMNVLREYLDVKEILIASSSQDTAQEGLPQNLQQIWNPRYGMLAQLAPGDAAPLATQGLGRTIRWTDGLPDFVSMFTYISNDTDSNVVRARQFTDEVIQMSFAAELMDLTGA